MPDGGSRRRKIVREIKLFSSKTILYCSNTRKYTNISILIWDRTLISWGFDDDATLLKIESVETLDHKTKNKLQIFDSAYTITLPFTDRASRKFMHCICIFIVSWIWKWGIFSKQTSYLEQIPMRLGLKQGVKILSWLMIHTMPDLGLLR